MAQVFLVDRDDGLRATLRHALEAVGHTVTEIADDREAEARLRQAPGPAVVLVDYTQLWSDGARFAEATMADPAPAGGHVYLLTTTDRWPLPPGFAAHVPGPAVAVLLKPFEPETLVAAVDRAAASIAAGPVTGGGRSERPT